MGYVDPQGTDRFSYLILDLAHYLLWALMGGLITAGTCSYGGYAAHRSYQAWQNSHPRGRRHWRTSTSHEAARGIGEIEAYLATCPQLAAPPPPSSEPAQQQLGDPPPGRPDADD